MFSGHRGHKPVWFQVVSEPGVRRVSGDADRGPVPHPRTCIHDMHTTRTQTEGQRDSEEEGPMLQEVRATRTFGTVNTGRGSLRGSSECPRSTEGCVAVAGADRAVCWGLPRSGKEDPTGCRGQQRVSVQLPGSVRVLTAQNHRRAPFWVGMKKRG